MEGAEKQRCQEVLLQDQQSPQLLGGSASLYPLQRRVTEELSLRGISFNSSPAKEAMMTWEMR